MNFWLVSPSLFPSVNWLQKCELRFARNKGCFTLPLASLVRASTRPRAGTSELVFGKVQEKLPAGVLIGNSDSTAAAGFGVFWPVQRFLRSGFEARSRVSLQQKRGWLLAGVDQTASQATYFTEGQLQAPGPMTPVP